jgi:hypothetical protein
MTDIAPIALFAFNRPDHLGTTLKALGQNELAGDTELTIFCDGPRSDDDLDAVAAVRRVAASAEGFKQVNVVAREENMGLAVSVMTGVTAMLDANDTVIVVEDDLVTSPCFLKFMNEALNTYSNDERVISVCGYSYPVPEKLPETYFLGGAHCWGWATWRRGWDLFEADAKPLLEALENDDNLLYEYDRAGSYPHAQYLLWTTFGQGDSWALRWMASAVVNGKLTLYPGRSLVANTGMDSSGTHESELDVYDTNVAQDMPRIGDIEVCENPRARRALRSFHVKWRRTWRLKFRIYYLIAAVLPERIEKKLYARIVRQALRRIRAENQERA